MNLIDTHCHLQDDRITDLSALLERAESAGITGMICCGTRPHDWPRVLEIARRYPRVRPMLGLHPWYVADVSGDWMCLLEKKLMEGSLLGIGECGLDGAVGVDLGLQVDAFKAQLDLATRFQRPLSIHARKAWAPLIACLDAVQAPLQGAMHAFSGSWEMAQACLNRGLHLSFTCRILDDRSVKARQILEKCPLDRVLLETDSPDMGLRGAPSEPAQLHAVLQAVAEIKGMDEARLAHQLMKNAQTAFGF